MQFQWRHHSGGGDSWQDDLAQLSGGQRSLIAIALLVAVRTLRFHLLHVCCQPIGVILPSSLHQGARLQIMMGGCSCLTGHPCTACPCL